MKEKKTKETDEDGEDVERLTEGMESVGEHHGIRSQGWVGGDNRREVSERKWGRRWERSEGERN